MNNLQRHAMQESLSEITMARTRLNDVRWSLSPDSDECSILATAERFLVDVERLICTIQDVVDIID